MLLYKASEGSDYLILLLSAGLGNLFGSLVTYGMGRVGNTAIHQQWLRISEKDLIRAESWFNRWGAPSLLLAWLPVVGDPLCLLAGLLRVNITWFVLLVGIGKFSRYAFLLWIAA